MKGCGWKTAPIHYQAQRNWICWCRETCDWIINKSCRYNILSCFYGFIAIDHSIHKRIFYIQVMCVTDTPEFYLFLLSTPFLIQLLSLIYSPNPLRKFRNCVKRYIQQLLANFKVMMTIWFETKEKFQYQMLGLQLAKYEYIICDWCLHHIYEIAHSLLKSLASMVLPTSFPATPTWNILWKLYI